MILNPECVRDILLLLEKCTAVHYSHSEEGDRYTFAMISCPSIHGALKGKYSIEEIAYVLIQLSENGYINMDFKCDDYSNIAKFGTVRYVTPRGHDMISGIQNEETWKNKISPIFRAFGNVSLSVIESISKGIATATIESIKTGSLLGG